MKRNHVTRVSSVLVGVLTLSLDSLLRADPTPAPNTPAAPVRLLPLNDNSAPPFKAVYRWAKPDLSDAYGPWLNRTIIWSESFMPTDAWEKLEGQEWMLGKWAPWVHRQAGRRYVLSVPILAGSWDGKGPNKGSAAHVPVSLEKGAKGTYNVHFQRLAENLIKHGLPDTVIRVGWEFNGGWYIWRANTAEKAEAYAAYFRQIVTTMRAVPGADKFKFVWNPAMEPHWAYPPEKAWPGDDVVDLVGVDVYDQSWGKDTYPIPETATEEEQMVRQKHCWDNVKNNEKSYGLPYWVKFAAKHGKPLSIPEWGTCIRADKHGGGDDVYFIEQMFNFIYNPANNVYFECYFDVGAPDGDHQLVGEPDGKRQTRFPKAAAKYQELFTLPPGAQVPVTPAAASAPAAH